ncbi:MAG: hypothetical protein ATN36_04860 [Epulopiscium sp. Nele67-Bin005]|nr:MAG: hypothetical protein ATN36_04860 [Epulopiscium sp. Nele67-Bin005]
MLLELKNRLILNVVYGIKFIEEDIVIRHFREEVKFYIPFNPIFQKLSTKLQSLIDCESRNIIEVISLVNTIMLVVKKNFSNQILKRVYVRYDCNYYQFSRLQLRSIEDISVCEAGVTPDFRVFNTSLKIIEIESLIFNNYNISKSLELAINNLLVYGDNLGRDFKKKLEIASESEILVYHTVVQKFYSVEIADAITVKNWKTSYAVHQGRIFRYLHAIHNIEMYNQLYIYKFPRKNLLEKVLEFKFKDKEIMSKLIVNEFELSHNVPSNCLDKIKINKCFTLLKDASGYMTSAKFGVVCDRLVKAKLTGEGDYLGEWFDEVNSYNQSPKVLGMLYVNDSDKVRNIIKQLFLTQKYTGRKRTILVLGYNVICDEWFVEMEQALLINRTSCEIIELLVKVILDYILVWYPDYNQQFIIKIKDIVPEYSFVFDAIEDIFKLSAEEFYAKYSIYISDEEGVNCYPQKAFLFIFQRVYYNKKLECYYIIPQVYDYCGKKHTYKITYLKEGIHTNWKETLIDFTDRFTDFAGITKLIDGSIDIEKINIMISGGQPVPHCPKNYYQKEVQHHILNKIFLMN